MPSLRMRPFLLLLGVSAATLVSAAAVPRPDAGAGPSVRAERAGVGTRIWLEAGSPGAASRLLRETVREVTGLRTGAGPAGVGQFAVWEEDGERWSSHSRDAGATWSPPRPRRRELKLRDGDVAPGEAMPVPRAGLRATAGSRLYIVQLATASLPEWRAALAAEQAKILAYLPHDAHIVRLDPARLPEVRALAFVERLEPYHPSYRIEPGLRDAILDPATSEELRVRVVVFDWGRAAKERVIAAAESLGARVAGFWPSGHVLELWADSGQLREIAALDDVQSIDRWTPPGSDMDLVREDSGANRLHDEFDHCGHGVRGEVMDGGIQHDHQDFDGILLHGDTGIDSHGTATYGIVFGNGDIDGDGDGQAIGHLPCGQGIFAAYPETTDRFAHTQELKQAPWFASFQTNSWGSAQTQLYTSASQEMDDIVWRLDIAILNSQSNTGNRNSRPQAWAKNVISVGGIRHYDTLDTSDDAWLDGASIGPAQDGRIKPDVSYWYDDIYTTNTGDSYTQFGGTSAATPESAGVLGLLVEMWADDVWHTDPAGATAFEKQPHFSTLKALLINTAQQYDFTGSGHDLSRFKQGWGRPSAGVAQQRAATSFIVDEADLLELDDSVSYAIDVPPGESELKVTMVYPDPPGTTSSSMHRINDVNLTVTSPSATIYLGNVGLEDGIFSIAGGAADVLNTVENVFVPNPEAGSWTVTVEAVEVNQDAHLDTPADDVAFALVVTGGTAVTGAGAGELRVAPQRAACEGTLSLEVRDGNTGQGSLTVDVSSDSEAAPETVTLQETNPGSGNFRGAVDLTGAAAAPDGAVSVADGDTVAVEYVDADDGAGGSGVPREASVEVDCAAPVISNVRVSELTDTEAVISWSTDEGSNSSVRWSGTVPPDALESRAGNVLSHNVRLRGLAECTSYFYEVGSADSVGNVTTDDNGGSYYLFTTLTRTDGQLHSCRDGTLILEADTVGCSGSVPIRLTDTDLNQDPGSPETAQVWLSSSSETVPESVILTEDGADTGVFTGFIPTGAGVPVNGDGILQTADRDLITGRYDDPDDGSGNPVTSTYTIDADCAPAGFLSVSVQAITDATSTLSWLNTEPTTAVVEWGATPALGNQVASATLQPNHSVQLAGFAACDTVWFRIVATDAHGNDGAHDAAGEPFAFNAWGVPGVYLFDDFETDAGWTLEGEWELGPPQGLGSPPGDPSSAFSGADVLGHDLSGQGVQFGDYEPESSEAAISPVIDGTTFVNTELRLRRRLNVTNGSFAYIDVRDSGGSWRNVWQTSVGGVADSEWAEMAVDIAAEADNNAELQIRIRERSFLASSFASGWNVDDLVLRDGSQPAITACGGCGGAPAFAGLLVATDEDPCADSGVSLVWSAASAWGTGTGGSYAVYRGLAPGFPVDGGTLLQSGITTTSWTDPAPPADVDLYYVVRAENDETCAAGPANGGVTDGNLAVVAARNDTAQAPPADVGETLFLEPINGAHARLTWQPAAGAAEYRVYRSAFPDLVVDLHGTVSGTQLEDRDVLTDGQTWYYLVQAADACGNEGP